MTRKTVRIRPLKVVSAVPVEFRDPDPHCTDCRGRGVHKNGQRCYCTVAKWEFVERPATEADEFDHVVED
jgi:hypothetical protein